MKTVKLAPYGLLCLDDQSIFERDDFMNSISKFKELTNLLKYELKISYESYLTNIEYDIIIAKYKNENIDSIDRSKPIYEFEFNELHKIWKPMRFTHNNNQFEKDEIYNNNILKNEFYKP